jgi:hypothetical protein
MAVGVSDTFRSMADVAAPVKAAVSKSRKCGPCGTRVPYGSSLSVLARSGSMAAKTVDDLKLLRTQLIERRRREAYSLDGPHHSDGIARLVKVHHATEALDAAIMEGMNQPSGAYPRDMNG